MKVDGACLCRHITYEAEIDPDRVAVCHCNDCQVNSGSAFGVVASVINGQFKLLSGSLQEYKKIAESGRPRTLAFCGKCGTRIYAHTKEDPAAFFGLRVGSIRQRAELVPKRQVWCDSALPWVDELPAISKLGTQAQ